MHEIIRRYNNYHLIKEFEYCHDEIDNIIFDNVELFGKKINASVSRGELLLIKGGNGSGKTTLLKKLMGFENHENILINGSSKLYDDLVYVSSNNLDNRFVKDYKESSAGEFRIKQIKQYANLDRSLYIFDEPTNYVDVQNKKIIFDLIYKLLNNNKIVIIVTHDNLFDCISNKISIML